MSDTSPIIVEGRMAVEALMRSRRFDVLDLVVEEGRHQEVVKLAHNRGVPLKICSPDEIREAAGFDFHRGIFARVTRPGGSEIPLDSLRRCTRLVLPLGIADPGNLGTIIRSAAAFGSEAILVEKERGADVWGRKAIRASATAVFRLPVYEVTDSIGLLEAARSAGFVIVGTSLAGGSIPLAEASRAGKTLILLGAEKDGLDPEVEQVCDTLVRIPMENEMDSLNVAATAAIVSHHFFGTRME